MDTLKTRSQFLGFILLLLSTSALASGQDGLGYLTSFTVLFTLGLGVIGGLVSAFKQKIKYTHVFILFLVLGAALSAVSLDLGFVLIVFFIQVTYGFGILTMSYFAVRFVTIRCRNKQYTQLKSLKGVLAILGSLLVIILLLIFGALLIAMLTKPI